MSKILHIIRFRFAFFCSSIVFINQLICVGCKCIFVALAVLNTYVKEIDLAHIDLRPDTVEMIFRILIMCLFTQGL